MNAFRAICPAKVNLALRVLGRRADGFHELVTLFQAIDLSDELEGEEAEELSLDVRDSTIPGDEDNLVMRAARLLQSRVQHARGRGARLRLLKRIPAGAGLGGGSSDAAGALVLLNELWGLGVAPAELAAFAAELGSDVPFFLVGGTSLGTGRGELIAPLRALPERPLLLGSPPFGLRTADVYRALRVPLTALLPDVTVPRLFVKFAEGNDFALASNDLERAAFAIRGELATFREAMTRAGAELALLSGSGSTVFGLFRAGTDVNSKVESLRGAFPDWTFRASRTIATGVRIQPAME